MRPNCLRSFTTREADDDTIAILQKHWAERGGSEIGGIIHCFTGTQALADATLAMGFHLSFSGVVTFKAAEELRAVALTVPLERMLIETDCPFLAPIPYRGKRNEPAYVVETAKKLADLRGISVEELAQLTTGNFKRLFSYKRDLNADKRGFDGFSRIIKRWHWRSVSRVFKKI